MAGLGQRDGWMAGTMGRCCGWIGATALAIWCGNASASTPNYGVHDLDPGVVLPAGSTILVEGFQLGDVASYTTAALDGQPVDVVVSAVAGLNDENVVQVGIQPPPTIGQSLSVSLAPSIEQDVHEEEWVVVAADDRPPSTPTDVVVTLVDDPDVQYGLPFRHEVDFHYVADLGEAAWERMVVQLVTDDGTVLSEFLGDPRRRFGFQGKERVIGELDPATLCVQLTAIDGAGHFSETARACVSEDLRGGDGGCRVAGSGTSLGGWSLVLLVLAAARRGPYGSESRSRGSG